MTQDDRDHWLRVFAVMFSRSAFEREARDAPSFHDRARQESAFYEERVAKNLSDLVFTLDIKLALGRPDAYPEARVTASGFKDEIDGTNWLITDVTHRLDQGGYVTDLKMETAG